MANAELRNGTYESNEGATRFNSWLVFPVVRQDVAAVIDALCDLADSLDTGAGFVGVEQSYSDAHTLVLGLSKSLERVGMSTRRRIERRGRDARMGGTYGAHELLVATSCPELVSVQRRHR